MPTEICEHHQEMVAKVRESDTKERMQDMAIEGKVSKSSLKWVAAIFAIPTCAAILSAWAFIASADYRYGSNLQAQANAANIKLLDERTLNLKGEILRLQNDIFGDLTQIKLDLREIGKELRLHSVATAAEKKP